MPNRIRSTHPYLNSIGKFANLRKQKLSNMPRKNTIFPHKCRHLKPKQHTGYTGTSGISACETNPAISREDCENVSPNLPFASIFSSLSHRPLASLVVTVVRQPFGLLTRSYFLSPFQSFLRQPTGLAHSLSQNLTVVSRSLVSR